MSVNLRSNALLLAAIELYATLIRKNCDYKTRRAHLFASRHTSETTIRRMFRAEDAFAGFAMDRYAYYVCYKCKKVSFPQKIHLYEASNLN